MYTSIKNLQIPSLIITLLIIVLFIFPNASFADEDVAWHQDKTNMEKNASTEKNLEKRCQLIWDVLWPWAKKGNLEARSILLLDLYNSGRIMPAISQDLITIQRHTFTLAVHSAGYREEFFDSVINQFYDAQDIKKFYKGKFFDCVEKNRSSECTEIALRDNLVPTFEQYAAEVDMYIENGHKSECNN